MLSIQGTPEVTILLAMARREIKKATKDSSDMPGQRSGGPCRPPAVGLRFLQPLIAHFRPDLRQQSRVPFPLAQPSQVHGPIAPQRGQRHLGRGCRPCLDGTGLVAVTGDQVVVAVDLGVALERDSQGGDQPDQLRGHRTIWRVERDVDCPPDQRAALLDEIGEEAYAVGVRGRDQKA